MPISVTIFPIAFLFSISILTEMPMGSHDSHSHAHLCCRPSTVSSITANKPHCYRNSHAIWDHTVLLATPAEVTLTSSGQSRRGSLAHGCSTAITTKLVDFWSRYSLNRPQGCKTGLI